MKIEVLLMATLKDLAGQRTVSLTLADGDATIKTVRQELAAQFPQMEANIEIASAAINDDFAFDSDPVNEGDRVAFFPPVSGGGEEEAGAAWPEIFLLPETQIDHDELIDRITSPATGAVCLFSGKVRGETHIVGHLAQTERLEYEAYEPMALAKMRQVAAEIRAQWPLVQGIAIVQRVGRLEIGQTTVLIACSSGHRDEGCFEAARYGIDRLKEIVPVWKKEIGPDGETWIEGDYVPTPDDRSG